jgi:prephenate dehydratase
MPDHALGVLGPTGTYTDLAATKYLRGQNLKLEKIYFPGVTDVFVAVEKGKVTVGIAPVENLIHGTVRETMDELFQRKVHIIRQIDYKINHVLVALPGVKKSAIAVIASHEQALNQCRNYLARNFPNVKKQAYSTTITALQALIGNKDKKTAVIMPEEVASRFPVQVLARKIQDDNHNKTKFVIIKEGILELEGRFIKADKTDEDFKTSIAFCFKKDQPGSLYLVFEKFAKAGINLTRIESRPSRSDLGNYIFYLDLEGSIANPVIKKTLLAIKKIVAKMKLLGSYPQS